MKLGLDVSDNTVAKYMRKSKSDDGKRQDVDINSVHTSDIRCHEFLGGLLKSYIRKAV